MPPPPPSALDALPRNSSRPPRELPVLGSFAEFDILGRLAMGGMAEILLARHIDTDGKRSYLVVKRILAHFETDNEYVQMFLDEARIGTQLRHPNIIQFFTYGADAGSHFITMEWVNGMPLGRVIRRARKSGGLSLPLALYAASCTAKALHHAHVARDAHDEAMRLIHRDVSPHNIMVSYEGEVKLLDFGIAKADTQAHKTQAGVVKGKFAYMAPEQCVGGNVDHRLDIFALGVVLFESITGKSLYRRDTEAATMRAIIMDPVPSLKDQVPDIPDAINTIVMKALAKEPEERFQTAEQFANALEEYMRVSGLIVGQADMSDFMLRAFATEAKRGPQVDSVPFGSSYNADIDADFALKQARGGTEVRSAPGTREFDFDSVGDEGSLDGLLAMPEEQSRRPSAVPSVHASAEEREKLAQPPAAGPGRAMGDQPRPSRVAGLLKFVAAFAAAAVGLFSAFVAWNTFAAEDAPPSDEARPGEIVWREPARGPNPLLEKQGSQIIAKSSPPMARVIIDGEVKGSTPTTLSGLLPGRYTVRFEAPGFVASEQTIDVVQGEATVVESKLLGKQGGGTAGTYGMLNVDTYPMASVYVAGDLVGESPLQDVPVPTGVISVLLKRSGEDDIVRRVSVRANRSTDVNHDY